MQEILLFGKALKAKNLPFSEVNKVANQKGYLVHPDCCNTRVMAWLETLPINYNSTFYKSWDIVVGMDRFELFIDQVLHYMTTYGTDYTATPYIPNSAPDVVPYSDYTIILPITTEEIGHKVQEMFDSGIALKQETIDACLSLVKEFGIALNLDSIKNKEALMYLYSELDELPTKPEEVVRYLIYMYTGKTLLIKDSETIAGIKANPSGEASALMERFGLEKLSQVFHRFKPLFLAMKSGNEPTINKLRKLADKYHKPYEFGYFETILSGNADLSKLEDNLKYLNNYKKVLLLQTIKVRNKNVSILPVVVRNQKLWVTERKTTGGNYYSLLYSMIYKSLISSLAKKACKVKLHPNINLALPTSEKSFIGAVPFGSTVNLDEKDMIVGINWKCSEGASDLDLSGINTDGVKFGWDANYYNDAKSVMYSGDMTSANPEATELLYCANGIPDMVVKVNAYNAKPESKFTLFLAKTKPNFIASVNCMVDPNEIVFSEKLEMSSKEMLCGLIIDNKFQFANLRTGKGRVSNGDDVTTNYINYANETSDCYLDLRDALMEAGFTFVDSEADIDLSVMDKSTLIYLLA